MEEHQDPEDNSVTSANEGVQIKDDISEDSVNSSLELDNDVANFISSYAVFSEQDPTMDQTTNNANDGNAFYTTNAGDFPVNVVQDKVRDTVTGHVILNQVGSCVNRQNQSIEGTSRQQHLLQGWCASIPGKNHHYYYRRQHYFHDTSIYQQKLIVVLYLAHDHCF